MRNANRLREFLRLTLLAIRLAVMVRTTPPTRATAAMTPVKKSGKLKTFPK
jgi:hypothetical protein